MTAGVTGRNATPPQEALNSTTSGRPDRNVTDSQRNFSHVRLLPRLMSLLVLLLHYVCWVSLGFFHSSSMKMSAEYHSG